MINIGSVYAHKGTIYFLYTKKKCYICVEIISNLIFEQPLYINKVET